MVQLVQKWLTTNGKSKNLVGVQSTRLGTSSGLSICQSLQEVGSNASEGMDVLARRGQEGKELALLDLT